MTCLGAIFGVGVSRWSVQGKQEEGEIETVVEIEMQRQERSVMDDATYVMMEIRAPLQLIIN